MKRRRAGEYFRGLCNFDLLIYLMNKLQCKIGLFGWAIPIHNE